MQENGSAAHTPVQTTCGLDLEVVFNNTLETVQSMQKLHTLCWTIVSNTCVLGGIVWRIKALILV